MCRCRLNFKNCRTWTEKPSDDSLVRRAYRKRKCQHTEMPSTTESSITTTTDNRYIQNRVKEGEEAKKEIAPGHRGFVKISGRLYLT